MKKIAVIDLGTNTFHLLIAEVKEDEARIMLNDKEAVKIGQGGINQNIISPEASERAIHTLKKFSEVIRRHGVEEVYAIATSAIRNASNGSKLIEDVKTKTGIEIRVVSGDKEAALIYEGVKYAMDLGQSPSIIMDIGGGSVEFILCNNEQIFWKQSFEIGAQRLLDMFHISDPITAADIQHLQNYLKEQLAPLFQAAQEHNPVTLVGSSGTFDTLCDIDVLQKGINFSLEETLEYNLSIDDFEKIASEIIGKNKQGRMEMAGMASMRADMIVVACILIRDVIHKIPFQKITVCPYALKEGVLSMVWKGNTI